jgi:hypothetical protein
MSAMKMNALREIQMRIQMKSKLHRAQIQVADKPERKLLPVLETTVKL